jgi:hypothetical protein
MKKILVSLGLIGVIPIFIGTGLWLFAALMGSGATTETIFTTGTFSDTIGANGNNDVTLLLSPAAGNGADGVGTVSVNKNLNTDSICGRTSPNWDAVNFSCIDNTAAGQN